MFFLTGAKMPAAAEWVFDDFHADNDTLLGPQFFQFFVDIPVRNPFHGFFILGF